MITIHVNAADVVNSLDILATRQIPFATIEALKKTGQDFRAEERARFHKIFNLHSEFTANFGVQIERPGPSKSNLSIAIAPDEKASFIDKFEEGGIERPEKADAWAVPVRPRPDPREGRPRQLLFEEPKDAGFFEIKVGEQSHLRPGIYQREEGDHVDMWYGLYPEADFPASLQYGATAERVVADKWAANFAHEFELALKDAFIGGGLKADITPTGTVFGLPASSE